MIKRKHTLQGLSRFYLLTIDPYMCHKEVRPFLAFLALLILIPCFFILRV